MAIGAALIALVALAVAPAVATAAGTTADGYAQSWTHRALELQYALAGDVPLRDAPWLGTHNSFNSGAEMGLTVSDLDFNQRVSLVDQLDLDMRSLELDLHWFPSLAAGGFAPVVCHAQSLHEGCSIEKPLAPVLGEIGGWLRAHPDQVLLLYLEDHLDAQPGHDAGAAALNAVLGDRIYRPDGGGATCEPLPLDLTRDAVLAAGKQVLVMSGCGLGGAWRGVAFDGSARKETRPRGFTDFPRCGHDFDRATYDRTIVRYFEDSTAITALTGLLGAEGADEGITPATAARMARCGVDLLGLDQLRPSDSRLDALVWSWAYGEPRAGAGDCAVQRTDGGFTDGAWLVRGCRERHRVACRRADGSWSVPGKATTASAARLLCRHRRAQRSVPRTGYDAQRLRVAMAAAHTGVVWLAYRRSGEHWLALDRRGDRPPG